MSRGTVHVHLGSGERALVRALVLVSGRGFGIRGLRGRRAADGSTALTLELEHDRGSIDVLVRQIRRLHDVIHVEACTSEAKE